VILVLPLTMVFLLSAGLTYLVRNLSLHYQILDTPNQRSSHIVPLPRGGGLAFFFVFYAILIWLFVFHVIEKNIFLSLLGGIPIAIIGYCDDLLEMKTSIRLAVQLLSSVWGLYWLHLPFLFFVIACISSVWLVNLYNFMDGIDGLAGSEAVFVSGVAGLLLWIHGFYSNALVCLLITSSVMGFLVWNWQPAKIFMGDVGSGLLGYWFAMLIWTTKIQHQLSMDVWIILLSVFLIDATMTLLHRMKQKKKWYAAHREHAYQRLVQAGFAHQTVTLFILSINVLICVPLIFCHFLVMSPVALGLFLMGGWLMWYRIVRRYSAR